MHAWFGLVYYAAISWHLNGSVILLYFDALGSISLDRLVWLRLSSRLSDIRVMRCSKICLFFSFKASHIPLK
jgi:hypothetical protein